MFHPDDYKKALDKMAATTPADIAEAMKPVVDYQAKLSKITLDATKKHLAVGQAMVNETMEALDRLAKTAPAATDMAAASSEFAAEQTKAMPKHMSAFVDIAKSAQAETIDAMVSLGQEAAATGNGSESSKKETKSKSIITPVSTRTDNDTAAMASIKKDVMAKAAKK
ncbi:MAG: hypothetical protein EBY34_05915 [Alphaproteobacteria bacterium]|nr:hypothetical protein [Alphaproteobacteria bacterium]NDG37242.1 hypothetical protein [Alphaproteobacteria bacterium]